MFTVIHSPCRSPGSVASDMQKRFQWSGDEVGTELWLAC